MKKTVVALAGVSAFVLALSGSAAAFAAIPDPPELVIDFADDTEVITELTAVGNLMYFVRETADAEELWYTDGDEAHLIETFEVVSDIADYGGIAYFGAVTTDGTQDGLWSATTSSVTLEAPHSTTSDVSVEELNVVGDHLVYESNDGEGTAALWAWDGSAETSLGEFDFLDDHYPVGDRLVLNASLGTSHGVWVATPGTGSEYIGDFFNIEGAAEVAGDLTFFAHDGANFGLWIWNGVDDPDLELLLDDAEPHLVTDDGRLLFHADSPMHTGLWSWDGDVSRQIGPEFPWVVVQELGSSIFLYGMEGTDNGYWELVGNELEFVVAHPEILDLRVLGGAILSDDYDPAALSAWEGTSAPAVTLNNTWNDIFWLEVTPTFAVIDVYNADASHSLWVVKGSAPLDSMVINPADESVAAGTAVVFEVEGFDESGVTIGDVTGSTTFSTDAPGATVDGAEITFTTAGSYTVTATNGSVVATTGIMIGPAALATIELSPQDIAVAVGSEQEFAVEAFDAYGNSLGDYTGSASFETDVPDAEVDGNAITFPTEGTGTVTATVDSITDSTGVQVESGTVVSLRLSLSSTTVAEGGSLTFTVQGLNANGTPVQDLTAQATVTSDHASDEIDGTTITFPSASPHVITATWQQLSDMVTVEVVPSAVPAGELGSTGFDSLWLAGLSAVLLLAGVVVVTLRIRRAGLTTN